MTIGTCPACGEPHASGAQTCASCGEPLSSVARVLSSPLAPRQPRWLEQTRRRATGLRREEATASEQRMEALLATDRRRLDAERQTAERTAARERRAVILLGVIVALLAVGAVVAVVLLVA